MDGKREGEKTCFGTPKEVIISAEKKDKVEVEEEEEEEEQRWYIRMYMYVPRNAGIHAI